MPPPVVAALLLGLLAPGTSGEDGAAPRCLEVQKDFHDCIAYCEKQRFDLNVKEETSKDKAGGSVKTFCGKITCHVEITLNCTDSDGKIRQVNYTWAGGDDPTSTAPPITGPTSMAPNRTENTTGLSPGAMAAVIIVGVIPVVVVISGVVIFIYWKRKRKTHDGPRIMESGTKSPINMELQHLNGSSTVTHQKRTSRTL